MKKIALVTSLAAVLFSGAALALPSAKFAASYDTDPVLAETALVSCTDGSCSDATPTPIAEVEMATIHVAQQKSLLIGVSAQTGIYTMTEAKGKKTGEEADGTCIPGSTTSKAEGTVAVTVNLERIGGGYNQSAQPGPVVFDARLQELTVSACTDEFVAVKLVLDTTAAHHFNFLGIELPQGDYKVKATYDLSALAGVVGLAGMAQAKVALGPRVITLQEVRAVKGSIVPDGDTVQCPEGYIADTDGDGNQICTPTL